MSLENKIVLITGASFGIGEATAHAFAQAGARVIISARTKSKLQALKATLEQDYQAQAYCLPLDVCDRAAVEAAITGLPSTWSAIDILINNAGLALGLDKIQDANLDDWDRMIDTNIKGMMYVSHFVVKGMIARDSGHIVTIGSISSFSVYPGGMGYCATKYAVRAISEGLKMDLHESAIRVTEIDPGMVDTEFSTVRFKGDKVKADAVYKGFEPLQASDIADSILYAVNCPPHVDVRQLFICPTAQTSTGMVKK